LIEGEKTLINGSLAAAKKGGLPSEKPKAAKVPSRWWWQTAGVFLSEATFVWLYLRK
jgi:hypothetical protein